MRFSSLRPLGVTVLSLSLSAVLFGCPQEKTQPAPAKPTVPSSHALQDSPRPPAVTDAGTSPAEAVAKGTPDAGSVAGGDAGATEAVAGGSLATFSGFNRDETQYAFSVYSEGAGANILQIVVGQQGTPKERFLLDSEESEQKAKAALEAGGFTSKSGTLPSGTKIDAVAQEGKAQVTVTEGDAPARKLYDGNPFLLGGGGAKVAKAAVDKVSPSGNVVAVRVESVAMTEFGGATSVILVRVGAPK